MLCPVQVIQNATSVPTLQKKCALSLSFANLAVKTVLERVYCSKRHLKAGTAILYLSMTVSILTVIKFY